MERIRIQQHSFMGTVWLAGWLFTLGFLKLMFWRGVLALVLWPYYLGVAFSAWLQRQARSYRPTTRAAHTTALPASEATKSGLAAAAWRPTLSRAARRPDGGCRLAPHRGKGMQGPEVRIRLITAAKRRSAKSHATIAARQVAGGERSERWAISATSMGVLLQSSAPARATDENPAPLPDPRRPTSTPGDSGPVSHRVRGYGTARVMRSPAGE
jgi:hypothetical protein